MAPRSSARCSFMANWSPWTSPLHPYCILPQEEEAQAASIQASFPIGEKDFYNWNKVKVRYCDGASFAGEGEREVQNIGKNLPKECISKMEASQCFFPEEIVKNINTPFFILNSAYDSWQVQHILAPEESDPQQLWLKCKMDIHDCDSRQLEVLQGFRNALLEDLREFQQNSNGGMLINSCFIHCYSMTSNTWHSLDSPKVDNKVLIKVTNTMDMQQSAGHLCKRNSVFRWKPSRVPSPKGFRFWLRWLASALGDFYNWNKVKVRYCDGASFAGEGEREVQNGKKLYFRGQHIWKAIMEDLLLKGLENARQAFLTGCSSGGLATFIHCDDFHALLPKEVTVKCLADAGFFIDEYMFLSNFHALHDYFFVYVVLNVGKNLPKECISRMEASQCFFPEEIVKNLNTPLFILNSAYDGWQVRNILAPEESDPQQLWLKCRMDIHDCDSRQLEVLQGFRNALLKDLREFQQNNYVICYLAKFHLDVAVNPGAYFGLWISIFILEKAKLINEGWRLVQYCGIVRFLRMTALGSSHYMERQVLFVGILSNIPSQNLDFYNWNKVRVRYCDGASYSGNVKSDIQNGTKLFFRGQRIWEAIMDELLMKGLTNAKQPGFPRQKSIWMDISKRRFIRSFHGDVVRLQCFFAREIIKNINTPLFILNSAYDVWQIQHILAPESSDSQQSWLGCKLNIHNCDSDQIESLQGFRAALLDALSDFLHNKNVGMFINSCFIHCQTMNGITWHSPNSPKINNKSTLQEYTVTFIHALSIYFEDQTIAEAVGDGHPFKM
ncbi:putative Pectin acetylesterase [Cocos nucifera]|uniref:Putative Pectin acetylesterase n=1 Tax=Cocos nucifera TaxID=13894 RepID=A0A8K0IYU0_COCNU|nr:putative Pectin acetylesterase [Cocos nucifera]